MRPRSFGAAKSRCHAAENVEFPEGGEGDSQEKGGEKS